MHKLFHRDLAQSFLSNFLYVKMQEKFLPIFVLEEAEEKKIW